MKKHFCVLIASLVLVLSLHADANQTIKYKTSNEIGWSYIIPSTPGDIAVSVDEGEEIETTLVFLNADAEVHQIEWTWSCEAEATSYCYRLNGSEWQSTTDTKLVTDINECINKPFNLFEIYAVVNGEGQELSKQGLIVLDKEPYRYPFSTRLTVAPYSLGIFDFFNGHDIPNANYLTKTKYGVSSDIDFGYYVTDWFKPYFGLGYTFGNKQETIVPEAKAVQYAKAFTGFDLTVWSHDAMSVSGGVFLGGMMHINAGTYNTTSILGARIDFYYDLNKHLALSVGTKATAAYVDSSQDLLKSMTYIIDPITVSMEVRF